MDGQFDAGADRFTGRWDINQAPLLRSLAQCARLNLLRVHFEKIEA